MIHLINIIFLFLVLLTLFFVPYYVYKKIQRAEQERMKMMEDLNEIKRALGKPTKLS